MPMELMGAVARNGGDVEALYLYPVGGGTKVARKEDGWPGKVRDAAKALIDAADQATNELNYVAAVQVYTAITDRAGSPGRSQPGEMVDITFVAGATPPGARIGDDEVVPADLAAARDAFKAAILAALNSSVVGVGQ